MPRPRPATEPSDESLDELPPLDGDADEEAADDAALQLGDELESDEAPVDFDDAELGGDPTDELEAPRRDEREGDAGEGEGGESADDLDIGEVAASAGDEESLLDDTEGPAELDDAVGVVREDASGLDQGEEGFDDEDTDFLAGELPELDGDNSDNVEGDTGDEDDTWLADDEPPPWDDLAWERAVPPLTIGAFEALALAPAGVLAVGRVAALVEPTGASALLEAEGLGPGELTAVHVRETRVAVVHRTGGVFLSRDGGLRFEAVTGWIDAAKRTTDRPAKVVVEDDGLVVLTASGALLRSRGEGPFGAVADDVSALALGASGFVALLAPPGRLALLDGRGAARELPPLARGLRVPRGSHLAVRGEHVAVLVADVGVFRLEEGAWARLSGSGRATALTFVDDAGTLVFALHDDLEERARIVRAPLGGEPRTVIEVGEGGPEGSDGRVESLVWDGRSGCLWAAGSAGVVAVAPRRPQ